MLLIDGNASENRSVNIFKNKHVELPPFKSYSKNTLSHLFMEIKIYPSLSYLLARVPHFDRTEMGHYWGENPDSKTIAYHNDTTH
jgi:hypothetical protein